MKNIQDYPIVLKAEHIADILGIHVRSAYELMEETHFPLIRVGRRKRVQREDFFGWLEKQKTKFHNGRL